MLTAHHISKSYNIHTILKDVSFSINHNERLGLIGPNGCGKTTLLQILAGLETPDEGQITLSTPDLRIGYLAQGFELDPDLSLGEVIYKTVGESNRFEAEVEQLASALAAEPNRKDLQSAYDTALQCLNQISPLDSSRQVKILAALGLAEVPKDQPIRKLSGGQKTRLALGFVLFKDPHLLLLDEPTNHLDIQMLEWLESWLSSFPGAALIVSHDRTFLDRTVNRILDLDPETHTTREYVGNYSEYLEKYILEYKKLEGAYHDQEYEIRKIRQDIARTKQKSLKVELTTTSRQPGVRRIAKKVAKKAKSREKKLQRYLESDERVAKPKRSWQMKLEFPTSSHQSQQTLVLENLAVGYPGNKPLLRNLNLSIRARGRIVLTGPNASGKTTLIRTIAGHLEPLEGRSRLGTRVKLGYMAQEQEMLDLTLTPLETIQYNAPLNETEARSFLHFFLFTGDNALRRISNLSFGERSRLALATLVVQGCNFLLLDEPINHLDIPSRERFEQALSQFEGTVLAVVHDRYFIKRFASEIWLLENQEIKREGNLK